MKIEIPDELIEAFVEDQAYKCAAKGNKWPTLTDLRSEIYKTTIHGYIFDFECDLGAMIRNKIPEMKASQEEANNELSI